MVKIKLNQLFALLINCNFAIIFFLINKPIYAAENFVTTNGTSFTINGVEFKSIGVNRYNLMTTGGTPYIGCGGTFNHEELVTWFSELQSMGVTSARFWLFQEFTKGGTDLTRFNELLSLSEQYNVKLIPVFENHWEHCTQGGIKNNTWYQTGYRSPYGAYSMSLKSYINRIVPNYVNNPQIMMWQIMNEAEASDTTAFYNFAKDVSSYIKTLDQNHLVSLGTMGSGQAGWNVYKQIHALSSIDVLEYHDYNEVTNALPQTLSDRINDSISLNKPLIIGEAGITLTDGYTKELRARYFENKMKTYFNNGGSLYMIWSYREVNHQEVGYDFDFSDPLAKVVSKFNNPSPTFSPSPTPTPTPTPTSTPTPTLSTKPLTMLGGMNLNSYCINIGLGITATVTNSIWTCTTNGPIISMSPACKWQYNNPTAEAVQAYAGNPYSWSCFGN